MEGGIRESWDKSEVCQEDQWRIQQGSAGHFHSPCSLHGSHWSLCQEGASISLGPSTMSRATGDPDGHLAWKRSNFCCYKTWSILLLLQQSLAHPDEYTVATWEWGSGEKKERDCVVGDLEHVCEIKGEKLGKGRNWRCKRRCSWLALALGRPGASTLDVWPTRLTMKDLWQASSAHFFFLTQ